MSDFIPDLDDPRARGWGGHDASLHSQDADDSFSFRSWFFIYFLPPSSSGSIYKATAAYGASTLVSACC